jgi:3-oxoacyl-[acyl-carrier protein] reductase
MIDLQDQVAIITGASRGIGAACARLFAEAGAHIGLVYHSRDDKAQTIKTEVEQLGRQALLLKGDVADYSIAQDHVQQVVDTFGKVDILVNNAGIIHISSTAGQRGEAFHSHYAATKGGIIAYTKSLAVELAPEIRVNAVAPGWVDTDMSDEVLGDSTLRQEVIAGIPLKRLPPAEDLAGPVLFLASDLARHITGEILNVNGGAVLCG